MLAIQTDISPATKTSRVAPASKGLSLPVMLYLLTILVPFAFWVGPLNMTGVRAVLILLIVPLALRLLMGRYGRVLPTDILFALHIVWMTVALMVNNPDQAIQNAGSTGVEFIGGYLLGRAFIRTPEAFVALIKFLTVCALLLLPAALYEIQNGHAILLQWLAKLPVVGTIPDVQTWPRYGLHRVQAVFGHPIHYGLFSTIVFSLCFVGLKGVYSDTYRWLIAGLICMGALTSMSSGALLAVMLQMMLIFWAWMLRSTPYRWSILLGLFVVAYIVVDLLSNRTPIMVFLSYATFSSHTAYFRVLIFEWGMVNIWANPIFGIGLNDWVRLPWMHTSSVDNFWLLMGMRYGIPGFVLLASGYAIALWAIGRLKLDDNPELWRLRRAWMFCFIGLTFTLCTVHVWHSLYSFVFFIFGSGMWLLSAQPQTARAETPNPGLAGTDPRSRPGHKYNRQASPSYARVTAPDLKNPTAQTSQTESVSYSRFTKEPPPNA